jgi:hypothetical protein
LNLYFLGGLELIELDLIELDLIELAVAALDLTKLIDHDDT